MAASLSGLLINYLAPRGREALAPQLRTPRQADIAQFDLNTASGARSALSTIDEILNRINSQRGSIGAHLSRTESAVSVLHAIRDNNVAASSRITDVDVAMESAELAKNQILQQVSSAVLAQANQLPALVLSLLSNRPPAGRATF